MSYKDDAPSLNRHTVEKGMLFIAPKFSQCKEGLGLRLLLGTTAVGISQLYSTTLTLGFERHLHALAPNNAHLVPVNAKRVRGSRDRKSSECC